MDKFSLDRFLEACGATGPLRLIVEHRQSLNEHILPQPFALAGTDQRADICLADDRVPRRAAYFQVLGGRLLCLDLTFAVNGRKERFPPHQWLDPGQAWQCGSMTVQLAADGLGASTTNLPVRRDGLQPIPVEITGGSSGVCRYSLKAPVVLIGKSSQCQIRLRDRAVSRFHCAMVNTGAGLWAVDLLGRGGISVNGAAIRSACLDDGDELRVGGFSFRPQPGPPRAIVPRGAVADSLQIISPPDATSMAVPANFGGAVGAEFAPMVALFTALQQQMADHFRLTMTSMVGSFQKMHSDQMRLIWDEMAQIRQLNEEVSSLKATLARLPAKPAAPRPAALAENRQPAVRPNDVQQNSRAEPTRDKLTPPQPANAASAPSDQSGPKLDPEQDVHAWVSRRVAEVQRERDGRWQKIVSFLTGAPS